MSVRKWAYLFVFCKCLFSMFWSPGQVSSKMLIDLSSLSIMTMSGLRGKSNFGFVYAILFYDLNPTSGFWDIGWHQVRGCVIFEKASNFGAPILFKLFKSGFRFWIWDIAFYLFKASKCDLSIQQSSPSNLFRQHVENSISC